ncbi:MAG: hypothetical protein HPY45_09335 [Anaerolineae bacterium]|nr:hypothetical protein [Anaerolineae bacterium]
MYQMLVKIARPLRSLPVILISVALSVACGLFSGVRPDIQIPPSGTSSPQPHEANTHIPSIPPAASPTPAPPLLPAPLLFLSDQSGVWQIWRIEMNGGFAHPITSVPEGVGGFDVSPVDGSLAYISANSLYISRPDGSQARMVVAGEPLGDTDTDRLTRRLSNPRWSPDGTLLAFGQNGVNILEVNSGAVRSLITNFMSDDQFGINNRIYKPAFWSANGSYLAAQVVYYEGIGIVILPAAGGAVIDPHIFNCCDYALSSDPLTFFLASPQMAYGESGFWRIRWDTGETVRLSQESNDDEPSPSYAHLLLDTNNRLHFFYEKSPRVMIADCNPSDIHNITIRGELDYLPDQALWAPDASLAVISGEQGEPLQVWRENKPLVPLETSGYLLQWGHTTEEDILLAGTPAPTFTPSPTLPPPPVTSAVISPENASRLQQLTVIDAKEQIYALDISPNGKMLALGNDNAVHLWSLSPVQRLAKLAPYGNIVSALDFSPDSRFLAVASWDHQVDLWDTTSFQKVRSFTGHTASVEDIEFSSDGRLLASTGSDNILYLWDVSNSTPRQITTLAGWGKDISFSPDGRLLALSVWDEDVNIWDVASGVPVITIPSQQDEWVLNLQFSPDGKWLALGDWRHRVTLWDVAANAPYMILSGHSDNPTGLAFSPDGRLLASAAEDGELRLWDVDNGKPVHIMSGTRLVSFSPDGRLLITPGQNLYGAAVYFVP